MNRSATAAGRVVAGGFAGQAIAANHEFTLQSHLVVSIRGLLLLPLVLRLNLIILLGRRSVEWADDDFPLRPRMRLWLRLNRLRVAGRGRAKSVPRDRRSGLRCTTVSQRTAICQHQRGNKECNAFRNHRDRSTARQSKTCSGDRTLARRHRHIATNSGAVKSRAARGRPS